MTLHVADENNESASGDKVEEIVTVQIQDAPPLTPSPEVDTSAIDPHKLKRKIDFRLLPWLTLLYLMNYLDRGSIGNARVCAHCTLILRISHAPFRSPLVV